MRLLSQTKIPTTYAARCAAESRPLTFTRRPSEEQQRRPWSRAIGRTSEGSAFLLGRDLHAAPVDRQLRDIPSAPSVTPRTRQVSRGIFAFGTSCLQLDVHPDDPDREE